MILKGSLRKPNVTNDGEIAEKKVLSLNTDTILKEEKNLTDFTVYAQILMIMLKKLSK